MGYTSDGARFAGTHLFVDMWGAVNTTSSDAIRKAILRAVEDSHATLIKLDHTEFGDGAGVTVFAILAESHICVNTWADEKMAAIDIFFCAGLDPRLCLPALEEVFAPTKLRVKEHRRLVSGSDKGD